MRTFCATMNINACLKYCNLDFIHSKNVQLCRARGSLAQQNFSKVQRTRTPPRRISFFGTNGSIFFWPRGVSKENCADPATPAFTTDRSGRSSGCSKARLLKVYGICCSLLSVLRCCAASLFLRTCFLLLLPVFFSFVGLLLGLDSLLRLAYCVVLGKK